jgi:hypothetical protein
MAAQLISVNFHDQTLSAAVLDDKPYVAMKPICENIGLHWEGQRQRIKRHPVLNSVAFMTQATGTDGKQYEMLMLPLEFLNGWLFGIDVSRIKEELKPRLIDYQRECFKVLADYFMPQTHGLAALPEPPTLNKAQQGELFTMVANKSRSSHKTKAYFWRRFQNHFKVLSYKHLPADRFDEAKEYLRRMEGSDADAFLQLSPRELSDIIRQNIESFKAKAKEGDYLPHERCETTLNSVDLAFLHCTWEETQKLIADLQPVLDMFVCSVPLCNVPNHLRNMQTAMMHLRGRFQAVMEASAQKHGLFDRKHYKPVLDAGMPEDNGRHSITLHLTKIGKGKSKRWLVTQAKDEMVVLHSLDDHAEVMTREQFIRELKLEGYIVAKPDELKNSITFKQ